MISNSITNGTYKFQGQLWERNLLLFYANIYLAQLEQEVLQKTQKFPLVYWRFLDDIFLIWPHSRAEFQEFFELMNNHNDSIKLNCTINEKSINFLDITVLKGPKFQNEQILDTKAYFKSADTPELLHKLSFHPPIHSRESEYHKQLDFTRFNCSNLSDTNQACTVLLRVLRLKQKLFY